MIDYYDTPEERAECDDLITRLFWWSGKGGLYSTWRERHIALCGGFAGFTSLKILSIPPCPDEWKDEQQYYESAAIAGTILKLYLLLKLVSTPQFTAVLAIIGV